MKIIVLHGDHEKKSYERLKVFVDEAKKRDWDIRYLDNAGKLLLSEQLSTSDLFNRKIFYVLQNLVTISKRDLQWLKLNSKKLEGTLILYHKNTLSKTFINQLPKPDKIEEYKLPKLIWSFLESFYPGNCTNCFKLLHQIIENEPVEFVFALLARQMRDLYWVNLYSTEPYRSSGLVPFPSWKAAKLKSQARKFKKGLIKKIINELARIDIKVKTSKTNLADSLDLLMATKLE